MVLFSSYRGNRSRQRPGDNRYPIEALYNQATACPMVDRYVQPLDITSRTGDLSERLTSFRNLRCSADDIREPGFLRPS